MNATAAQSPENSLCEFSWGGVGCANSPGEESAVRILLGGVGCANSPGEESAVRILLGRSCLGRMAMLPIGEAFEAMHAVEMVVVVGIASVLATSGYRAANERRDAARVAADLSAVAALAVAYQAAGADCGRPQGTLIPVEDMMATLGTGLGGPDEPAAWSVRYYSRPPSMLGNWPPFGSPTIAGSAFDVVRSGTTSAERAALESRGGRREGQSTVVVRRLESSGVHRARRTFAAGRAFTGC